MMREEWQRLRTDNRTLRSFGLVIGTVLVGLGAGLGARGQPVYLWLAAVGATLGIVGAVAPARLRPIYRAWMGLALVLGTVVATLLLLAIFFLVVTPLGLLARLAGRDFLGRTLERGAATYWLKRDPSRRRSPADYERQF